MKRSLSNLLLASTILGAMGLDSPLAAQPTKRGFTVVERMIPLTKKQKKVRAKNKAARKARKINRLKAA